METLLRKYLWALDLAVVVLVALFSARATGVMIESALIRQTPPPKRVVHASAAPVPQTVYTKDTLEILKRNIFCSTCPSLLEEPKKDDDPGTPAVEAPVRTNLPLRLMAVMYSPPPHDPRWSMAVIRDTTDQSAGPYGVGSKIRGATVEDIQETRVYLRNQGKAEFLDLVDKGPPPAPPGQPAPPPTPVAAAPAADPFAAELQKGIKQTSEHAYEVQKSTLDSMLGNMAALSRAARIVPEVKDGKSAGFRLFSIRPDGPFGRIGLQNGDVIVAINGLEMTDPTKALEVYTKLRTASHLSVSLERNGAKITKDYTIR